MAVNPNFLANLLEICVLEQPLARRARRTTGDVANVDRTDISVFIFKARHQKYHRMNLLLAVLRCRSVKWEPRKH
jgi:hypothetical protein